MRILISAYDLEQTEHRGIAVYSKGLIHCLAEAGAEIWLLTQFDYFGAARRRTDRIRHTQSLAVETLVDRFNPVVPAASPETAPTGLGRKLIEAVRSIVVSLPYLFGNRCFRRSDLHCLYLRDLHEPGRLNNDRLMFLRKVTGFVCAPNLYRASQIAALVPGVKPFRIDCKGFDVLVTACPLFLRPASGETRLIQTVHDLIPLQLQGSGNRYLFLRTLMASAASQRIFVSCATSRLFYEYFGSRRLVNGRLERVTDCVLFQMPSLAALEADVSCAQLKQLVAEVGLEPLKYILSNSFIEPRKNIEFLIRAFAQSGLAAEGYQLCVVGKKQQLSYSRSIENLSNQTPGVKLVGYVDELKKAGLFLYAGMLASPSHLEGFGIPVLDAACLGMPVLASTCEAYLELFEYHDFSRYLSLVSIDSKASWVESLSCIRVQYDLHRDRMAWVLQQRLIRYQRMTKIIEAEMKLSLHKVLALA